MSQEKAKVAINRALAAAADPRFTLIYLFPHPKQKLDDASPFGWYTPGILDTAEAMRRACELPADIREAHSALDVVLVHRLAGSIWPHLLPVEIDSLEASLAIIPSPFIVCVTTDQEVAAATDLILKAHSNPVLHVSSVAGPGRTPPEGFNLNGICSHVRKVLDRLCDQDGLQALVKECRSMLTESPQRKLRKHPLRFGGHNVTAPNETALAAFGYKFPSVREVSVPYGPIESRSPDYYVERICNSADAVASERAKLLIGRPQFLQDHRAIIAVASSYSRLYSTKKLLQRVPADKRKELRHALGFVLRQTSYFQTVQADIHGKPILSPITKSLTYELGRDMRAFTSALSMLSSATLCPVLRIEPKINEVRVDAAELARCVRAHAGSSYFRKQSRMLRVLGEKMQGLIHNDFLVRINKKETSRIEGLKLITDLPLELLPSNGIPLGLRFDTSRVSPVPGNLFWQTCSLPPIQLRADDFYSILIVRSFNDADPIRGYLEKAVGIVAGADGYKRVKYSFVDVKTPGEFVEAVNSFSGAVMIFDGHGRYDNRLGIGRLVVGDKPMDTWELKRVCRLPPVVMFSACDTQPIDGNHGSVATSAFALGAHAVLGTMFPVNAFHSSVMMARMLLRIDQFLPIAASWFPVLNWRHLVSGMLRMSHTTEASRTLNSRARLGLTEDALGRIQLKANREINSWLPSWFDTWIDSVANESSRSSEDIRRLLERHVGLTDAMKYVQLGQPEKVLIH